jgi:hypothetical protein
MIILWILVGIVEIAMMLQQHFVLMIQELAMYGRVAE